MKTENARNNQIASNGTTENNISTDITEAMYHFSLSSKTL